MSSHLPAIFKPAEGKKTSSIAYGKFWIWNTLAWLPQEWFWYKVFPGQGQNDTYTTIEQLRESC